jgi:hypothetical protein
MLVRIEPLKSFIAARSLVSSIGTTTILTRRGTDTGHENAVGMACVGVRVERTVRLVVDASAVELLLACMAVILLRCVNCFG